MKAVIIENQFQIPEEVLRFINANPGLFSEVNEQIACSHRPFEDIARFVIDADALILKSSFMNKPQLEKFVEAFANGVFSKKEYKFFIYDSLAQFNNWIKNGHENFKDSDKFNESLIKLITEREVYWFDEKCLYEKIYFSDNEFYVQSGK